MKKKKKALTLLEVILALSLLSLVLFAVTNLYKNFSKTNQVLEKVTDALMKRHLFCSRMDALFAQVKKREDAKALLYSVKDASYKGDGMAISWDNKVEYDPKLSGIQRAKLFCDGLSVGLSYEFKHEGSYKEILLEGVERLEILYFDKEKKEWIGNWDKQKEDSLSMIRFKIFPKERKDPPWEMGFFVHAPQQIVYGSSP